MRQRLCKVCNDFHAFDAWPRECIPVRESKRSPLGVPYIRTDGMDPIMNHANGQMYDSRSAYERGVKDAGCEIIGNEKIEPAPRPELCERELKQDIKTAMEQVEARL
jgi:hypothetical protein